MSAPAQQKRYTPDDLLDSGDADRFELVNGELVEKDMSFLSNYVAGELQRQLGNYSRTKNVGWSMADGTTYRCFPFDRARVRKPDLSFIRLERFGIKDAIQEGHVTIAPDLIVEVISPNEKVRELEGRISDFLRAGTKLVWVIYPENRTARVHRPDGTAQLLSEQDDLSGEDVVPGFRCKIRDLFLSPTGELLEVPPPTSSL